MTSYEIRSADLKEVLQHEDADLSESSRLEALKLEMKYMPVPAVIVRHTRESELEAETARLDWLIQAGNDWVQLESWWVCDCDPSVFRSMIDEARDAPKPVVEIVWPKEGG